MIRPLLAGDVVAARVVTWAAINDLDARLGSEATEGTPEMYARSESRVAHLLETDPGSCFVAEVDGLVVGCALALVREGMWYLSLLMVDPAHQGRGVGRQLMDAVLATSTDRSWIMSSPDPAAVRRYQRAGFELHPTYSAKGAVDRARVPSVQGVREGSYAKDADLLEHVSRAVRGASIARDLEWLEQWPAPFLVVDDAQGQGWVLPKPGGVAWVGATTEDAARRLLWTAIAEAGEEVEVDNLTGQQQWAIDLCLDAHLALRGGGSICLRGQQVMTPYLPNGALG